jgi:uroporphyrinogen decarboxylase
MHYEKYDRLPVPHFGFWAETLEKWFAEGHVSEDEWRGWGDANEYDRSVASRLGFDFNYYSCFSGKTDIYPLFEARIVRELPDGSQHRMQEDGAIVLWRPNAVSIPAEIDHTLKDRESWERHYLPRLQWYPERIDANRLEEAVRDSGTRTEPLGLEVGSLFGKIRNWMGVEGVSYLYADDEDLYGEIIKTLADVQYKLAETLLESGAEFDYGHFWEDIAFKTGPLVTPSVFHEKVGPHYRRFKELLGRHGIGLASVDCDGDPTALIPTWLENGVNVMFPIEVGTWGGSFAPWRERHGKALRGVGGMDERVFAMDYSTVDAEIERLRPIVELGGYIPCPDHRIPPDAIWENVQHCCDRMRRVFG